jgi:transposase
MLNGEDWDMIKQMRERGCYLRDIAAEVEVSEKTVRRALKRSGPAAKRRSGQRESKLDSYKAEVDRLLGENVWNAQVILAHIRDRGYSGGRTLLCDYIRPKRVLRKAAGTVRFETEPGQQLQHDWGEVMTQVGGERTKVYFAVNLLGYSRRFHVWAAGKNDAEHTYESLVLAFEYLGGVPAQVWVDNQKAAVIEHKPGRVVFNAGFKALAGHYGFRPKACRPHRPQTKGKDERMVGYVKDNFFQRYRAFEDIAHLNQLLEHWLADVADQRLQGTVKEVVIARFARERWRLQPLPPVRFDTSYREVRRVAMDALIDVRGNRYSVPAHLVGERVFIAVGLDDRLRVFDAEDTLVAEHWIKPAGAGWQVTPEHHQRLWSQIFQVQHRDLAVYEEAGQWN